MPQGIDVAVIPAAGRGTRMLPATRTVPKAFLPIVDRPALHHAVEEASSAGVAEAVIVTDPETEEQIHQHFDGLGLPITITTVVQRDAAGLGDAVLQARRAIGDRMFLCLLVDRIPLPGHPILPRLAAASDGRAAIALLELSDAETATHGVVSVVTRHGDRVEISGAVEKPGPERAPSRLGIAGRYLLTPAIFDALAAADPGVGGEIQLTDAIDAVARSEGMLGIVIGDDLLDVGNPLGLAIAKTVLAAADPAIGADYRAFLAGFDPADSDLSR